MTDNEENIIPDETLKARTVEDWIPLLPRGFNKLQDQLDDMARWYLLQHPDFVTTAQSKDPAIKDKTLEDAKEELLSYPWVAAIAAHEVAHFLYTQNTNSSRIEARRIAEAAKSRSGIDIHPGTQIGENCFIDHGTADVIGETATIGNNTLIYHNVTLGAYKSTKPENRHPKIGDNCTISTGTNILGSVKVGNGVRIGPNAVICGDDVVIGDKVKIKTRARIMEGNKIADKVTIGEGAVVPENMGIIDFDVPADSIVIKDGDKLKTASLAEHDNLLKSFFNSLENLAKKAGFSL